MRRALIAVTIAACGGASAPPAIDNRAPSAAPAGCPPGGVELRGDLDGDGTLDTIRITPDAKEVTCLEIHASTAPTLVCGGTSPATIERIEIFESGVVSLGAAPCDPAGVAVDVVGPDLPGARTFRGAINASVAPTGTGLWLDGGDAWEVIVWRDGGWRQVVVGA